MGSRSESLSHNDYGLELRLKFLLWNLENFFLVPHIKSSFDQPLKAPSKVAMIVELLNEIQPDIMFFCEMGGEDSLLKLKSQLNAEYDSFYTEGNSDRGIGISFLAKKSFANYRFLTHTHDLLPPITLDDKKSPRKFSRDAAELWLCDELGTPKLIIWGVHLKSGQDRQGNDWRGIRQRSAEVRGLVALVKLRQQQYPGIQQWLGGDFNGQLYGEKTDPEFEHLHVQLPKHRDILEHLELPQSERWSFALNSKMQSSTNLIQLDYLLIPPQEIAPNPQETGFMHLWQRLGVSAGWAKNASEKELWPSDHLPLLATWPQRPF